MCVLPLLPLPLHPLPICEYLKGPCQITLKNHTLFSPHIHLKFQGKILSQFQILHQVTLPELNTQTCQNILQLNYLQNNLHQLLLPPKNNFLQWKYPRLALYTPVLEATRRTYLPSCLFTMFLFSQWISLKLTISDPIWQPNGGSYLSSTMYMKLSTS